MRFTRKKSAMATDKPGAQSKSKALFSASISSHIHETATAVSCAASGFLSRNPQDLQEGAARGIKRMWALHPPVLWGRSSSSYSCACPCLVKWSPLDLTPYGPSQPIKQKGPAFSKCHQAFLYINSGLRFSCGRLWLYVAAHFHAEPNLPSLQLWIKTFLMENKVI